VIKVGDKVRVKLHEPVGNPTTDSANSYLSQWKDKVGTVHLQRSSRTWIVRFDDLALTYKYTGTFYDYELEVVDD